MKISCYETYVYIVKNQHKTQQFLELRSTKDFYFSRRSILSLTLQSCWHLVTQEKANRLQLYHFYKFSVYNISFYLLSPDGPLLLPKLGPPGYITLYRIASSYTDIYILNFYLFNSMDIVNLSIQVLLWNSSILVRLNHKQNVTSAVSKFHKDEKVPNHV